MNKLELSLVTITLILVSFFGAWVSSKVRTNELGVWATFFAGNLSLVIWYYLSKSKLNLVFASNFYDIVMAVSWTIALVYLGDKLNFNQILGVIIAVGGLVVFNL
jgi:small basic protein